MSSIVVYGQLMALLASLCGAVSSIGYNRLGNKADSNILAYVRMLIAFPMTVLYALCVDGIPSVPFNDFLILFASGFLGFFITDMFMFHAYVVWGASQTMVVMCLSPALSAVSAFFLFGEALSALQILGIALVIGGVTVMVSDRGKSSSFSKVGFLCALSASVLQSVCDITAKLALSHTPALSASAIRGLGGILGWIVFAFIMRNRGFFRNASVFRTGRMILAMLAIVCVGTVLGPTSAMTALKFAPAGIVTSLKQMAPVFIIPLEAVFFGKKPSFPAVCGTLVCIVGIFLVF